MYPRPEQHTRLLHNGKNSMPTNIDGMFPTHQVIGCYSHPNTYASRRARPNSAQMGRTFQVVKQVSKQAYPLELPAHWKIHDVFHVSQLQVYTRSGNYQPPPPAELLEGEPEYEVDHIVRHRGTRKHKK